MKKIGFCAIGGSGMSALAQVLNYQKQDIYGTDRSFDQGKEQKTKQALTDIGIKIYPQDGSMLDKDFSVLYASTAVEDSIPDIKRAKELQIPIKHRSDLLSEIFASYKYNIAIGGTSGKSTITAMIGYILDQDRKKPLVINGALLKNYETQPGIPNVILNDGDFCVIEADESDGSIQKYTPYISVVNNITLDHKPIEELQQLFGDFIAKAKHGAVLNKDCPNSKLLLKLNPNTTTFSIKDPSADFYATNITAIPNGTQYTFQNKNYTLKIIGAFNVANALCAVACCSQLGIDPHDACRILQSFLGTKRRLEILGQTNNITVIDDFAHNPDKVAGSMSALKSYDGRLIIMFQPHGFSPMRLMGKEIMDAFISHMSSQDILLLPEIFFAGGTVKKDISSRDLVNYAKRHNVNAHFFNTREELKQYILKTAQANDRIVLMGARDNTITEMGYNLLEELK
ncbi:MAG: UDP-N-acetylmuramate--alanine ligase [Alphaproteobacteria bacterium]|nr:UDP-N-acetylmuramate--alanine ligase [Alphaproteobacteria bacterium]